MTPSPDTDAALRRATHDPTRPRYHFGAPSGWMNDPNGTVFYKGYYHVFYQWNPESDRWGNIHWGHARSRDLVTWEHLPVALKPDPALGEAHCFSGCLVLRREAPPLILYTAIGPQMDVRHNAQQWAALGDDDLIVWQKHPRNPILTAHVHGEVEVLEWRDPFVFVDGGRTFLLLGGKLSAKDGNSALNGQGAVVLLYEAQAASLEDWRYRGILFQHPDLTRASVECANFFRSGQAWVLLLSTHQHVEYFLGDFDADVGRFTAHTAGFLDGSDAFYATNILQDDQQRHLCFGWIRGFALDRGWSGCLSLPRVLFVDEQGILRQTLAPELDALHLNGFHASDIPLGVYSLPGFQGDALDIHAIVVSEASATFGIKLIPSDKRAQTVTLTCSTQELRLNDKQVPLQRQAEETNIRLLLDRSVVEVFVNACVSLTLVLPPIPSLYRIELFSEDATVNLSATARVRQLDVWPMDHKAMR